MTLPAVPASSSSVNVQRTRKKPTSNDNEVVGLVRELARVIVYCCQGFRSKEGEEAEEGLCQLHACRGAWGPAEPCWNYGVFIRQGVQVTRSTMSIIALGDLGTLAIMVSIFPVGPDQIGATSAVWHHVTKPLHRL
jgi:hypothetical protein